MELIIYLALHAVIFACVALLGALVGNLLKRRRIAVHIWFLRWFIQDYQQKTDEVV